ncbi:AlbA family DNA-binding domain-containing protein [Leptospira santarosai]|uniref:AlbA family DNA-binding domain-containing protein n=1 Tax=Leptospira santarosai TaxID=28183 RepID=UPI0024AEB2CA|nr:ATP-binding protein [Leptospira santarosai]MDI7174868.1 ATP-binding protein [Leptospira santarosai]MDI7193773.1 ATP-binding protein [Leptospira santarosai]MDO6395753.1 ATP-binding protein [Leptospira santarosai]MDO6398920.1 ATP-binding protein [Leptospira santarosai]MDO6403612.1 ATP-binding protein [Leptospira santarosai]
MKQKGIGLLVEKEISENFEIEFKKQINIQSDDEKREFLYDVSSFANSRGGTIYFGIQEENGIAKEIIGIDNSDLDQFQLKLENILRDSINPRIPNIQIEQFTTSNPSKSVLAIIIPASFHSPHMINYRNVSKFYGRNSSGKYILDVNEIGRLFLKKENLRNNMDKIIIDRIDQTRNGKNYLPLKLSNASIFIHILPVISADFETDYIDVEKYADKARDLKLISDNGHNTIFNFHGILNYRDLKDKWTSYTQIFRNGLIESYDTNILDSSSETEKYIPSGLIEDSIIKNLKANCMFLDSVGLGKPYIVRLTLLNVLGYKIGIGIDRHWNPRPSPIRENDLHFPSIILYDGESLETKLKFIFDMLWNASGMSRSFNYNERGEWTGELSR